MQAELFNCFTATHCNEATVLTYIEQPVTQTTVPIGSGEDGQLCLTLFDQMASHAKP